MGKTGTGNLQTTTNIVVMGKTGTGKSTLCNALLYGPEFERKKKFDMSASLNSCTHLT